MQGKGSNTNHSRVLTPSLGKRGQPEASKPLAPQHSYDYSLSQSQTYLQHSLFFCLSVLLDRLSCSPGWPRPHNGAVKDFDLSFLPLPFEHKHAPPWHSHTVWGMEPRVLSVSSKLSIDRAASPVPTVSFSFHHLFL